MFGKSPYRDLWLTLFLTASILSTGLVPFSAAANERKRKPVVVSFGQPNIWSLEQAHYLLARLHMTNLDLQAKALTAQELDPNAINGTRIEVLKQILSVGAQFDQGVGFQNSRLVESARFNDTHRRDLVTRRNSMQNEELSLTREISRLEIERARMNADSSEDQKKLKDTEIAKKKDELAAVKDLISQDNAELQSLGPAPSGTPASPDALPSPAQLPSSALEGLIQKNAEKLLEAAKDPKLNATTMLDNTVQLQYEIIAKQLTLLRDEVGPGERLIFLELPQSIYTTPGAGDEKMAQAWWHVNGYTRTDPLVRLLLELFEVEQKWAKVQEVSAYEKYSPRIRDVKCPAKDPKLRSEMRDDHLFEIFVGLKCERENAHNAVLDKLYREANAIFSRVEQNGARDTSEMVEAIRKLIAVSNSKTKIEKEGSTTNADMSSRPMGQEKLILSSTSRERENTRRDNIQALKADLLTVLSDEHPLQSNDPQTNAALARIRRWNIEQGSEFEKGIEFLRLDEELVRHQNDQNDQDIKRRTVRTIDIIPRQSSLNVNDIQDTVKATGILAAFKFLFGFAGQVNFQRQREQFEQFVHQELYASGFGKGNRDFGWTFGALPGTKRVAPGVRTTYAALVVPEDAESIVLSARGCYFPRKSYQPLDFEDTGHEDWTSSKRFGSYNCGDDQTYIVAIPGGGETSNFWVTSIDYEDGNASGDFATVSVRGNNFSSQMGVLINGVPLAATVGLAQPQLMPKKAGENGAVTQQQNTNCSSASVICGSYERVDSEQIVFSFKMPGTFVGTPTITLIAPGKSVDLNSLPNLRIRRKPNLSLTDNEAPFLFGHRPTLPQVQILSFNPSSARVKALLTGSGFDAKDTIYVNGTEIPPADKVLRSSELCTLEFNLPADDILNFTVVRERDAVMSSLPNPAAVKIANATIVSYEPTPNNKGGVMVVKIHGVGFLPNLELSSQGAREGRLVYVSPVEVLVRLVDPEAPVGIKLTNTSTHGSASTVISNLPTQATKR